MHRHFSNRSLATFGVAIAVVALVLAVAPIASAQSCALCYQSAAASGTQGREVLRHGILVLLLPSVSLFVGILALIFSRNNPR